MPQGSLTVVGLGIKFAAHVSVEARAALEHAEKVLYGVADPASREWLSELNASAESLVEYAPGRPRRESYEAWVDQILDHVRRGARVCVAFYGHPGVFVYAGHEAVRIAREEGHEARMLPGISAEDCLYADLGLDPSRDGCQSFEATDFLVRGRPCDVSTGLVLWQIGLVGDLGPPRGRPSEEGMRVLREVLIEAYGAGHEVVLYEAAVMPILQPLVRRVPLAELSAASVPPSGTLYVPPRRRPPVDRERVKRLGIPRDHLTAWLGDEDEP